MEYDCGQAKEREKRPEPGVYYSNLRTIRRCVRRSGRGLISKLVHDLVANKMIEEGVQLGIDQGSCDRIAIAMITAVKNMR